MNPLVIILSAIAMTVGAAIGTGGDPDIRPIKGPVEIPSAGNAWVWVCGLLLGLLLLTLAYLAWRYWKPKPNSPATSPPIPAHLQARRDLHAALKWLDQPRVFGHAVSNAIRSYLEGEFDLHAPERTTEEFLRELQTSHALTSPQKQRLGDFLASCDLVKFARYEPGEQELRSLYAIAFQFVEETAPTRSAPSLISNRARTPTHEPPATLHSTSQEP